MAKKRTQKKKSNIQTFSKKKKWNIGLIIFGGILFYLLIYILLYVTGNHVTSYEVKVGSILNEYSYTGFIVRKEEIVPAENSGYVNFFAVEGSKVGAKTYVYTMSENELDLQTPDESSGKELTQEETDAIMMKIHAFTEGFNETNYDDVNTLKDNINIVLDSKSNQSRMSFLDAQDLTETANLKAYTSKNDGLISYTIDGFESVTVDQVTPEMLGKKDYNPVTVKNNSKVKKGDNLYKVIKSSKWYIVVPLTESQYETMKEKQYVQVEFSEDNTRADAELEVKNVDGSYLGYLTFESDMVRFSDERYIGIRIILDDEEGLKIPVSSVVSKDFYTVPKSYITDGGNSLQKGVLVKDKNSGDVTFKQCTVYRMDEDTVDKKTKQPVEGMAYLNPLEFEKDTKICKSSTEGKTTATITLSDTASMKGVYNINRGYADFRMIDILCQSDEYYIVQFGTSYGIASYDHIALDASKLKENEIVY